MDNLVSILGRRLDVAEPLPPEREGDGEGDLDGRSFREPPDDLPRLVAV
jgi:hypothetical protein